VRATHGALKDMRPDDPPSTSTPDALRIHLIGVFASGEADMTVTIGVNKLRLEIDDLAVGDLTLVPGQ
ncbi:MAG: hypothetical protein ACYS7M_08375, partial [Planctomycetota bacterium]